MNGPEADQTGNKISIRLRRNDFEACREIIDQHERQYRKGPEVPTFIAELSIDLRTINVLEKYGYMQISDLDDVDIDAMNLPNIGPVAKAGLKNTLRKARKRIVEAQDKKDRMELENVGSS